MDSGRGFAEIFAWWDLLSSIGGFGVWSSGLRQRQDTRWAMVSVAVMVTTSSFAMVFAFSFFQSSVQGPPEAADSSLQVIMPELTSMRCSSFSCLSDLNTEQRIPHIEGSAEGCVYN